MANVECLKPKAANLGKAQKSLVKFGLLLACCILLFGYIKPSYLGEYVALQSVLLVARRVLLGQEDFRALEALSNRHACVRLPS